MEQSQLDKDSTGDHAMSNRFLLSVINQFALLLRESNMPKVLTFMGLSFAKFLMHLCAKLENYHC